MKQFTPKQPWEELTYLFDFTEALALIGEDIGEIDEIVVVDITNLTEDLADTMVDDGFTTFSGEQVYVRLKGGTDGHRYKITVRVVSAVTQQKSELDAILPIREE